MNLFHQSLCAALLFSISVTSFANSSGPKVAEENFSQPSRLELRAMQTRKFNKPSGQIIKSIIELNKDRDISCSGADITFGFVGLRYGDPRWRTSKEGIKQEIYKGYFKSYGALYPGVVNCVNGYQFELTVDPVANSDGSEFIYDDYQQLATWAMGGNFPDKPKTTIVRLRINKSDGKQSFNPQRYQEAFKEIADGLFVDAIQLTPAEMQ
jgi:hypothetical protein